MKTSCFYPAPSVASLAALACLLLTPAAAHAQTPPIKPAQQCLTDLKAFDETLQKGGYWLHGSGYGYGYPMYGYGSDYEGGWLPAGGTPEGTAYWRARPGYEIRTLMATANIYAQRGDQATCETVLNTTRQLYTRYAAELQNGHVARVDVPSWRRQQIAAAVPVTDSPAAFRSDELVGAAVVNMEGEDLGSVEDIVMSPADGKVAYLVVSRGGIFGIGKKYVPVPWLDFKTAPGARLLVLATHKGTMDGAPQVRNDSFAAKGGYAAESMKVTDYWTANLTK